MTLSKGTLAAIISVLPENYEEELKELIVQTCEDCGADPEEYAGPVWEHLFGPRPVTGL